MALGSPEDFGACVQAERERRAARPKAVQRMRMRWSPGGRRIRRFHEEQYAAARWRQPRENNGSLATMDEPWAYDETDSYGVVRVALRALPHVASRVQP